MARVQEATVTVERTPADFLFHVRVLRRKRAYTLPLSAVARMVTMKVIMAEVEEKKAAKKKRKMARRGLLSLR